MERDRTEEKRAKSRGRRIRYFGAALAAAFMIGLLGSAGAVQARGMRLAPDTSGTLDEDNIVYYPAKMEVGSFANVRTGPGTSAEKLTVNGNNVQLRNGHDVLIIDEVTNTDNEVWYQIRFEFDGEEVEGYCRSDFMRKTGETITPTPTPSPSPSPSPSPKPTDEPSPSPSPEPTPPQKPGTGDGKKGSLTKVLLIVFLILFVLAAAYIAYYFLVYKKQKEEQRLRQKQQNGKPVARKRTGDEGIQGRTMRPESGGPGRTTGQVRPTPPGAKTTSTRPTNGQVRRPAGSTGAARPQAGATKPMGTTATPSGTRPVQGNGSMTEQAAKNAAMVAEENIQAGALKDTKDIFAPNAQAAAPEDRTALREEINNLEAGDYVMHKYLGIGQVYDNSDVKLIEIRFGSDMRFLNKESCIMKKILRRCREDEI